MDKYKEHLTLNIIYIHIIQVNLTYPLDEGLIDKNVDIKCKTKIVFNQR